MPLLQSWCEHNCFIPTLFIASGAVRLSARLISGMHAGNTIRRWFTKYFPNLPTGFPPIRWPRSIEGAADGLNFIWCAQARQQLAAAGLPASVTSQPQRGQVVHLHLYLPGPHLQLQHLVVFNHLGRITWPQNLVLNHLTTYQDPTAIWIGGKTLPSGRSRWLPNCY